MVQLHDPESSRELIRERLISKQWWVLLFPGNIPSFLPTLEERFYNGKRNKDFDILVGALTHTGVNSVVMALKRWASPQKLASFFQEAGCPITLESLTQRDILAFAGSEADVSAINFIFDWLRTRPGEPPIPALVDGPEASNGRREVE
jgi:hypothetical protein